MRVAEITNSIIGITQDFVSAFTKSKIFTLPPAVGKAESGDGDQFNKIFDFVD